MNAISEMVLQQLSGPASRQIAARLGISEGTANTAIQMAVPLLLSALARNASQPQGAEALHQAVVNDHDGSIFDNLTTYLGNPSTSDGAGILGHVFGPQRTTTESNLAQATGLDQGTTQNLLELVAPLVMGAVGQTQQQTGLDSSGLAQYLGDQQQQQQAAAPGMMGMLSSILDSNQDGNVTDDLSRIAGNFFK
jgi:hypothetical protein